MTVAAQAPQILFSLLCAHGIFRYTSYYGRHGVRSMLELRLAVLLLAAGTLCLARALGPFVPEGVTALLRLERALGAVTIFSAFLLVEAVRRRHYSLPGKIFAASLFVMMTVIGLLDLPALSGLAQTLFHGAGLAILAYAAGAILWRDRSDLTAVENYVANGCLIAGVLAVGLTALEFASYYQAGMLRLAPSPIAALILIFFVIRVSDGSETVRRLLVEQARLLFKSLLIGALFTLAFTGKLAPADLTMAFFLAWTLRLVVSISEYVHHRQREYSDASFLGWLAHAEPAATANLATSLAAVPGFADMVVVDEAALEGFDVAAIRAFYAANHATILSVSLLRTHAPDDAAGGIDAVEMVGALLARHQRTHAVCLATKPLAIGLVTLPELAGGLIPDLKIGVLQKFVLSQEHRGDPHAA